MEVRQTLGAWRLPVVTLACLLALFAVAFWIWIRARNGRPLRWQVTLAFLLLAAGAVAYPVARVSVQRPALVAGELDEVQTIALLQTLLKNVYRAFDFREEEDVYDKLALSVSGELLTDIYLQNRRSLAVQQAGGAQAKVGEVAVEAASARRLDGPGLRYLLDGRWTALGSVGHWGHVHQRKNRYQAEITVAAVDGVWKIVGLDIRDEQRIDQLAQESQAGQSANSGESDGEPSGAQTQQ
jgi:hypothetical protein